MNRYLKILGLALGAMLALGALSAASASAQSVLTTEGGAPVTLTGEEVDPNQNTFHAFGSQVQCESLYTGHKYQTQEETNGDHPLIPNGANTITITPHYSNCDDGEGGTRNVNMNGCDFVFHIGATTGGGETYGVTADVVCPDGATIAITGGACTVTVPPQTGLTGPHLTNTPAGPETPKDYIDLEGTFVNITATACHFLHTGTATLVTDLAIKGDDVGGQPAGVTISHD